VIINDDSRCGQWHSSDYQDFQPWCGPSWLAWSESWRPPGTELGQLSQWPRHDDSTVNFVLVGYFFIMGAKYCNERVCMSVCMSVCLSDHISKTTSMNFSKFYVAVIRGCGLVLLWQEWNTLSTSGFVEWRHASIFGHTAHGVGNSKVGAVLKQVVNISNVFARGRHVWLCHRIQWQQMAHRGRTIMSTVALLWPPYGIGRPLSLPCGFFLSFYLSSFLA